jgi:hypothetical protein
MARGRECFVLEVPPCGPPKKENEGTAIELPASAVGETIALTLGNATLTLPAPEQASFHALTALLLSHARIVDGDRLGDLLSSPSFPNLEKLRLEYLVGVAVLDLCIEELDELTIEGVRDLRGLVVNARFLLTLRVTDCPGLETYEWKYSDDLQLARDLGAHARLLHLLRPTCASSRNCVSKRRTFGRSGSFPCGRTATGTRPAATRPPYQSWNTAATPYADFTCTCMSPMYVQLLHT